MSILTHMPTFSHTHTCTHTYTHIHISSWPYEEIASAKTKVGYIYATAHCQSLDQFVYHSTGLYAGCATPSSHPAVAFILLKDYSTWSVVALSLNFINLTMVFLSRHRVYLFPCIPCH